MSHVVFSLIIIYFHQQQNNDESLQIVAELLGIHVEDIQMWLCNRKIVSGREVFTKPMTYTEVCFMSLLFDLDVVSIFEQT